jgi:hypothetical protein
MDSYTSALADKFVASTFVYVLKSAPAADVINEHGTKAATSPNDIFQ